MYIQPYIYIYIYIIWLLGRMEISASWSYRRGCGRRASSARREEEGGQNGGASISLGGSGRNLISQPDVRREWRGDEKWVGEC
jgi:hypothetical protein